MQRVQKPFKAPVVHRAPPHRGILLFLAAVLLAAALPGCGDEGPGGATLVKVNGYPITENEFFEEYEYQRSYWETVSEEKAAEYPMSWTDAKLKKMIFTRMLIPMAIVQGKYREKIPRLMAEAEEIKKKIAPDNSNFRDLAEMYSGDTNADKGGRMGILPRFGPPYPISRKIFMAEEGAIVGPFLSLVGCHILWVETKIQSAIPSGDRAGVSHILLPFEENKPNFLSALMEKTVPEASIEVLDPAYADFVK